jgi:hypothetical protein
LRYYWEHHASVQRAVQNGLVRDAFAHLLAFASDQGLVRWTRKTGQVAKRDSRP